jgi:ubiquinone/menaquinone biosynthesis C-methylase UbiE
MGMRETIVKQFGHPQGAAGQLVGWLMAHRSSNVRRNQWVVEVLDLEPDARVLEIGFGPGVAVEALARALPGGHVYGIDHSDVMVRQATKRNAATVRAGRVHLVRASVDDLPAFDVAFDAIIAVNNMWFWPDPPTRLKELRTLLRARGRIAIVTQPRSKGATAETSRAAAAGVTRSLEDAGYADVRVETLELDPPVVCVIGVNPAAA